MSSRPLPVTLCSTPTFARAALADGAIVGASVMVGALHAARAKGRRRSSGRMVGLLIERCGRVAGEDDDGGPARSPSSLLRCGLPDDEVPVRDPVGRKRRRRVAADQTIRVIERGRGGAMTDVCAV